MNVRRIVVPLSVAGILVAFPVAAGNIQTDGQFVSTVASGTPPLVVGSSTLVTGLNADKLDGFDASAFASTDGVVTIDQAKAIAGGVTPGDAPGFPVTIDERGSYRLTSNLDVTVESMPERVTAIEVTADDVTIDLGGFAILGPNECVGNPPTEDLVCTYTVLADPKGIGIRGGASRLLTVRNGVVRGMGTVGIACDRACVIEGVRATENGLGGLAISNGDSVIRDCVAFRNGGDGIFAFGLVTGSIAQQSGDNGMQIGVGGTAQGNVVSENRGVGIRTFIALLVDNMIYGNHTYGIEFAQPASWGRNVLSGNGTAPTTGTAGVQLDVNSCAGSACP